MEEKHKTIREPIWQSGNEVKKPINFEERKHHLLTCPNCNHFISAIDINIDKTIAKCNNCSHVFDFSNDFDLNSEQFEYGRPGMMIPDGLEVLRLRSELDIEINWFRAAKKSGMAFLIFFTIVWNLILLPFVLTAILAGQIEILFFTSLHLAVGLGLIYKLATLFLNTSRVIVDDQYIEFETRPLRLPWTKRKRYKTQDVTQLYVTKYVSSRTNGVANYAYGLYAIMKGGKKVKLLDQMNLETQMYLEQEIERFLKIKDQSVSGEVRK
jgi:hypothetical protein